MSSSNEREANKFGMDIPKENADQMRDSGKRSQEARKKGDEESVKLPDDGEEELLDRWADASSSAVYGLLLAVGALASKPEEATQRVTAAVLGVRVKTGSVGRGRLVALQQAIQGAGGRYPQPAEQRCLALDDLNSNIT
ncbi:hypothetical protein VTK73DRAFT_6347 [Phialemonium thermophilum]|uniref:Uncharacterized protein n=1 Tax=Phialemonium thermophilum TaxID=223376 RepID=A0ABR3WK48_9PEZI